jgi:outer membrane receptor protein involved in Fe transport
MRFFQVIASVLFFAASASAAEITIKVVDPQSAVVAAARVQLTHNGSTRPVAVEWTSAQGLAVFRGISAGAYRVEALAPGFVPQQVDVSPGSELVTLTLRLAPVAETVVVTATGTPASSDTAGAPVESLNAGELETMRPIASDDALRFLPGAIVDTQGQRGGLSSLFVRGGDSRYNKVIVDGVTIDEPGGRFDFGTLPLTEADRLEFVRGAQSALYGSDAMTSVVQVWTRTGGTTTPELRFGADGGNLETANGYLSFAGTHNRFDYNLFADQFNTGGQGPNDDYSNSLQGGNGAAGDVRRQSHRRHQEQRHAERRHRAQRSGLFASSRPPFQQPHRCAR